MPVVYFMQKKQMLNILQVVDFVRDVGIVIVLVGGV